MTPTTDISLKERTKVRQRILVSVGLVAAGAALAALGFFTFSNSKTVAPESQKQALVTGGEQPQNVVPTEAVNISPFPGDKHHAVISETGVIAWITIYAGILELLACDYSAGPCGQFLVGESGRNIDEKPGVSGDYIVWSTGTEIKLCEWGNSNVCLRVVQISSTTTGVKHRPSISGNEIVWEESIGGVPNIYYCEFNPSTGACANQRITNSGSADTYPDVSDHQIVWQREEDDGSDIRTCTYAQGSGCPTRNITSTSEVDELYPRISDNQVVWQTVNGDNPGSYLCTYDRQSGACPARSFSTVTAPGLNMEIDQQRIVWAEEHQGISDIRFCYLQNNNCFPYLITSDESLQEQPSLSLYGMVWEDNRNGRWDIYFRQIPAKNPPVGETVRLTAAPLNQWDPDMSGSTVAWLDNRRNAQLTELWSCAYPSVNGCEQFPVISGEDIQSFDISGNLIVWADQSAINLCEYNAEQHACSTTHVISEFQNPPSVAFIKIKGNRLTWIQYSTGHADIFSCEFNATTGVCPVQNMSNNGLAQGAPAADSNRIVWGQNNTGLQYCRIEGGQCTTRTTITTNSLDRHPEMSDSYIAWERYVRDNIKDIYYCVYNATTGSCLEEIFVGRYDVNLNDFSVFGDYLVWVPNFYEPGNPTRKDIAYCRMTNGGCTPAFLTQNEDSEVVPKVSEQGIVWNDAIWENSDVYFLPLPQTPAGPGQSPVFLKVSEPSPPLELPVPR